MKKVIGSLPLFLVLFLMLSFSARSQDIQQLVVSEEMNNFVKMLDGSESSATEAIQKYGSREVISSKIIPVGTNPKIVRADGDCYLIQLEEDGEKKGYEVCWENGKITALDFVIIDTNEENREG